MNIIEVKGSDFPLGRRGENLVTQIRFPIAGWAEKYGNGTFGLLAQRQGDADPYPVSITVDSEYVYWDVTSADTGVAGIGKAELRYMVGEALAKSVIYTTRTAPALEDAGESPEPYESWVNDVMDAAESVDEAVETVEEAVEIVEETAQEAVQTVEEAVQEAVETLEEIVSSIYVEDTNNGNLIVHGIELR